MEFVMIVEPDEVGRKRLEVSFPDRKAFFFLSDYRETGGGTGYIMNIRKTDVLVCETSLSVLSGREFFHHGKK